MAATAVPADKVSKKSEEERLGVNRGRDADDQKHAEKKASGHL
jgi:hypothetical protein